VIENELLRWKRRKKSNGEEEEEEGSVCGCGAQKSMFGEGTEVEFVKREGSRSK